MEMTSKDEVKYLEGKLKNNQNSVLFAHLADIYLSINKVDDAIKLCEKGIINHPYYITGHYILSKCYLYKRKYDEAQKELKRVLLFDPHYISAHRDYAELMRTMGWESSAETSYDKILEVDPLNSEVRRIREEFREKYQDSSGQEDDEIDLGEYDESSEKETPAEEDSTALLEDNAFEEFEKVYREKDVPVSEENEDMFNYILDDIFREENIMTEDAHDKPDDAAIPEVTSEETEVQQVPAMQENKTTADDDINDFLETERPAPTAIDAFDEMSDDKIPEDDTVVQDEIADEHVVDEDTVTDPFENMDSFNLEQKIQERDELKPWVERGMKPEQQKTEKPDLEEKSTKPAKKSAKESKEKIVTPTLAEIYIAQHQYAKAINVYERLKKIEPANEIYDKKIELLKKKIEEDNAD